MPIINSAALIKQLELEIQLDIEKTVDDVLKLAKDVIEVRLREKIATRALALIQSRYSIENRAEHLIITIDMREDKPATVNKDPSVWGKS